TQTVGTVYVSHGGLLREMLYLGAGSFVADANLKTFAVLVFCFGNFFRQKGLLGIGQSLQLGLLVFLVELFRDRHQIAVGAASDVLTHQLAFVAIGQRLVTQRAVRRHELITPL